MITDYIPTGRENAVSKQFLASISGLNERKVRAQISNARRHGICIIYRFDGGYYMPDLTKADDLAELNHFLNAERKRAREILLNVRKIRKGLRNEL